jgi:uncharacterized membrane protein
MAGTYTVTVTAYQSDGLSTTKSVTVTVSSVPPPPSFDFRVSATPSSRTIKQGESTTFDVVVEIISGSPETVSLGLSGLPSGASYSFSRESGTPTFYSTLTITIDLSAYPGNYALTITGGNGGKTHSTTVTLVVQEKYQPSEFDFSISAYPSTQSITQGESVSYSVTVNLISDIAQIVSLSLSGLPSGTSYSFSQSSGYPTFTSTLTITTSTSTPVGTFTLTIAGESDGIGRSTDMALIVQEKPSVAGNLLVRVFDSETRQPIQGVGVHVDGSYRGDTDFNGALLVSNLDEGYHLVALRKENYKDKIENALVEGSRTQEVKVYMEPLPGQVKFTVRFIPRGRYRVEEVGELDVKIKNEGTKTAYDAVMYWSSSLKPEQEEIAGIGSLKPGQETTVKLTFLVTYEGNGENEESPQIVKIERIVWVESGETKTATSDEWSIWVDTFVDKALGDLTGKLPGEKLPPDGVWVGAFETKVIAMKHGGQGASRQVSIRMSLPFGSVWKITAYTYNKYQWSVDIWFPLWEVTLPDVDAGVITLVIHSSGFGGRVYIL